MSSGRNNKRSGKNGKSKSAVSTSDIDHIVSILCDGDITKQDQVLWNARIDEIDPFIQIQMDKWKCRKGFMAYIGIKEKPNNDQSDDEYLESISHFKQRKGTRG